MKRRVLAYFSVLVFAFSILLTSILRTASIKYQFNGGTLKENGGDVLGESDVDISYYLAYPGKVLPGSLLWNVKALRDRLWLFITSNPSRKAELKLLFADKRLGAAEILFEEGKAEVGYSTLTKAEKYLEEASWQEIKNRGNGIDTCDFVRRIAYASLKHFEVMEEIIEVAPEDARPMIVGIQSYPKKVYEDKRDALNEKGISPPENPFSW